MTTPGAVVVGGSRAGLSVVTTLRAGGYQDPITVVANEQHLPYDRPAVSKDLLLGAKTAQELALVEPEDLAGIDVDVVVGTATSVDLGLRQVEVDTVGRLNFEVLFIATGSRALCPPSWAALEGVHTLRTIDDAQALAQDWAAAHRVVVVGGGFVGAEIASVARGLGKDVTIVDGAEALLTRVFGADFGHAWENVHRAHGTHVVCGVAVEALTEQDGAVTGLTLTDGRWRAADVVVVGIGARPATEWLRSSGLRLDNGVVCDEFLQAAPGVYAVGDAARWKHPATGELIRAEHWTNAHEQGKAAAQHHLGAGVPFEPTPYVWSDQYGKRVQIYGSVDQADSAHVLERDEDGVPKVMLYGREGRVVAALGVDASRVLLKLRRGLQEGALVADLLAST